MLGIEPGTKLWVFPEGCDGPGQLVHIGVSDMLVWRGDLVHAGAGYAQEHTRVHAYVDPPADLYERPKGRTNRCEVLAK